MAQKYYFVSDLHMGGDGQVQHCDYAAEFIEFLKELEKEGPDTEFMIVGDTFGFWELTHMESKACASYRRTRRFSINSGPPARAHQGDHDGQESRL